MKDGGPAVNAGKGMFRSDTCCFCGEYSEKVKPWLCKECWEGIKEAVRKYPELTQAAQREAMERCKGAIEELCDETGTVDEIATRMDDIDAIEALIAEEDSPESMMGKVTDDTVLIGK